MSDRDFRKKQAHIPIAREGIPYILAAMFATLITAVLGWAVVTLLLLAATLLIGHFFRDPERVSVAGESDILSPADGRVIAVNSIPSARFTDKPAIKISIFMSVFDVHVNRVPISGTIEGIHYEERQVHGRQPCRRRARKTSRTGSGSGPIPAADIVITQVAGLDCPPHRLLA